MFFPKNYDERINIRLSVSDQIFEIAQKIQVNLIVYTIPIYINSLLNKKVILLKKECFMKEITLQWLNFAETDLLMTYSKKTSILLTN